MQRNTLALIGVVVLGVLALGLTAMTMLRGGGQPTQQPAEVAAPKPVSMWVAQRDIPRRTKIERNMLTQRQMDAGKPIEGAIADPSEVVGKVVADTIPAGKVITANLVAPAIGAVVPANIPVPIGFRAVALWVNPQQTAAGLVDAGDRVDVVVNNKLRIKNPAGDTGDYVSGRTIGQYLLVLAVDRSIEAAKAPPVTTSATPPAPGAPPPPPPPPAPPQTGEQRTRVVVAAEPSVAERLIAANQQGVLHIIIRNPSDRPTLPVPEAIEYPVRIATDPVAAARAEKIREELRQEARENRRQNRADAREMARMEWQARLNANKGGGSGGPLAPMIPNPSTPIGPPVSTGDQHPAPSSEKEVTVIRGTEKTRVIVPRG